ncbi:MAG: hypothetical protein IIC18_09605 [Bacteroidetes bacterium]|nr:hypothetical protein [Bacteroidota bacterium]
MSKLFFQSYQETDTEISFDMKVMDDTLRYDYGWKHVVITKPLNPSLLTTSKAASIISMIDASMGFRVGCNEL